MRSATRIFSPGLRLPGTGLIVSDRLEAAAWMAFACSVAGLDARLSRKSDDRRASEISEPSAPFGRGLMITRAF